ncbi:hypothetical protein [Paludibacter jiangxiensis]|uniref:Lipoprotein n=1 Tax=Paludibacter jiangxiensis TaxID=681398 RepID=A0A161LDC5_9BACT|nr:hypothetical protein [Paludibacter jiangxiensis]GAT62145.1 hypothetical protein PJIAN_1736 [Paludibacter jiangxiensis]
MKLFPILFVMFIFFGCSQKPNNKRQLSTFSLERDIYRFSEKMNNGDTLYLTASIGACFDYTIEYNTIFKKNDSVFIQSRLENLPLANTTKTLPQKLYTYNQRDTLNFENLFYSLRNNITRPKKNEHNTFQVIFNKDTIEFVCKNLMVHLIKTDYYKRINMRIYSHEEIINLFEKVVYKP